MDKSNVTQLHPKDKKDSNEEFLGSSLSPFTKRNSIRAR